MDIYKLKDMPAEDRKAFLSSNAEEVKEGDYLRTLAEDELSIIKSELAQNCVQKGFIDNELKQIKDEFKGRLKPINAAIGTAIMCLTSRMKNESGKVYTLADYDNKLIFSVNEYGDVLNSRQMNPEERRQLHITPAVKAS